MADLFLHGNQISTVFDLLGKKENDLTYSFGWALANSEHLVTDLLKLWHPGVKRAGELQDIRLQERHPDCGVTDIELWTDHTATIIEAKRGWSLPSWDQLERYVTCLKYRRKDRAVVVLTGCTDDYAVRQLPSKISTIPVLHTCWAGVRNAVAVASTNGTHRERHLLRELDEYLGQVISVQNQDSNWVYVVSLGTGTMDCIDLGWIEVVEKYSLYFHPYGNGWHKEPPNYLGFRHHGQLRRICHVDGYEITNDLFGRLTKLTRRPSKKRRSSDEYALYRLGPAILPAREVRTGSVFRAARHWAALDLLLTCDTVAEARDKTKERQQT